MPPKKIAILQSNYIPWRGYFDFINSVDVFVFFDDVQYTRRDWRNRNKIKTAAGAVWLTVPVNFSQDSPTAINATCIDYATSNWIDKHIKTIHQAYSHAKFYKNYITTYQDILQQKQRTISALNQALIRWICQELGIRTQLLDSASLTPEGTKTDRLLDILKKVGGSYYLSGPAAKDYIECEKFREAEITLAYKSYTYQPYPQLHGAFEGGVSVLDLLFNVGPDSHQYIHSTTPGEVHSKEVIVLS